MYPVTYNNFYKYPNVLNTEYLRQFSDLENLKV